MLFPRDLSFLNTDTAQASHARVLIGLATFIHRQGDPARVFSVIEEGQVEVLQSDPATSETKVLAVLGKGDFFGEGAMLGNRPHETSIRARTAVRLQQVGSALFSQFAGSFTPLRDLLSKAVRPPLRRFLAPSAVGQVLSWKVSRSAPSSIRFPPSSSVKKPFTRTL